MTETSIHQAEQSHLRNWRARAAYHWRQRAIWARAQAQYNAEWHLHADWCEAQARALEESKA